jgi:hypothetical protein
MLRGFEGVGRLEVGPPKSGAKKTTAEKIARKTVIPTMSFTV